MKKLLGIFLSLLITTFLPFFAQEVMAEIKEVEINDSIYSNKNIFTDEANSTSQPVIYVDNYSLLDATQFEEFINANSSYKNNVVVAEYVNNRTDNTNPTLNNKTYNFYYEYSIDLYSIDDLSSFINLNNKDNFKVYLNGEYDDYVTYYVYLGNIDFPYILDLENAYVTLGTTPLTKYSSVSAMGEEIGYCLTVIDEQNYLVANVNSIQPIRVYLQNISAISNVSCGTYEIISEAFFNGDNGQPTFSNTILVPHDIYKTNNNDNGFVVSFTNNEQQSEQNLIMQTGDSKMLYDENGNQYLFFIECSEISNIGMDFVVTGNQYQRCDLNSISNNEGIVTYYYDLWCGNKSNNYTITFYPYNDSQVVSENNIVLNGSNTSESVELLEGGDIKQRFVFTLKLDNSGSDRNDYYNFGTEFKIKEFKNSQGSEHTLKDNNGNTLFVFNSEDNAIYVVNEAGLRKAIDMLKYYDGGKIVLNDDIAINDTPLVIDHKTSSIYSNSNKKYTLCNEYLVIDLNNHKLAVNTSIDVEMYARVAFVGSSVNNSSIVDENNQRTGALINNNGYLQFDKVSISSKDYVIDVKDNSITSFWDVNISGTNAGIMVTDNDVNSYSLFLNGSSINSDGCTIGDLRTYGKYYSTINLENSTLISSNDVAIRSKQKSYLFIDSCNISGKSSAIDIYKGTITINDHTDNGVTVISASSGPIFNVHYSENVDDIVFNFYGGYFNSCDYSVIEEIDVTNNKSSINEIKFNVGVFISNQNKPLFNTKCINYNIEDIVETKTNEKLSYGLIEHDQIKYAKLSFSGIFLEDAYMYNFYKYHLGDDDNNPYRIDNEDQSQISGNQYVVRTNKTISVKNITELEKALNYSNVNICLEDDIINNSNSNQIINVTKPSIIMLHGHNIINYTLKFDYPKTVNNNDKIFQIWGKFTDGGNNTYQRSSIKNEYGPSIIAKDNVFINGVEINSADFDEFCVIVEDGARLDFSSDSKLIGKKGFEVINSNSIQSSLRITNSSVSCNGYAVYAHSTSLIGSSATVSIHVSGATIQSLEDTAIYSKTNFYLYMDSGLVEGKTGVIVDSRQPVTMQITGGKIHATGESGLQSNDNDYSTIRLKKKQDFHLSLINCELISDAGYVFAFDDPQINIYNSVNIYSGNYCSGKDYIFNRFIGELKYIKGGYYSDHLLNTNQESLIANNYAFKQIGNDSSGYPYAIVRELKAETKIINGANYSRSANSYSDVIGDSSDPITINIDENSLLNSLSDDDIKDYADNDNNIDILFTIKAESSSEGKTEFEKSIGNDTNLEYLDMSVRCLNNYQDIHKTSVYQTIKVDIPNSYFDGTNFDISKVYIKHYKNVNGQKNVVLLPMINKADADKADFECAYIDGNSLIIITKDFSDYELVGTTSTINTVDASSLGELKGFYGDNISTINLPFGWEWKNKTEKISAEKELYFATNNGVEVGLHINASVKSDEINGNIETGNSVSGENYSEIVSDLLNNSTGNLLTEINNNAGKSVSMKPTLSIKDKNSQEVAADVNKVETNNITKDLTIGSVINIDLYMYYDGTKGNVPVTEISKPLMFTFKIPEEIRTPQSGYERRFYVVSVHNDNVSVLHSTTGNSNENISVGIDGFSNFMLCYKDYAISNNSGNDGYKYLNTGIN